MSPPRLHLVVPGPLDQQTGGYIYDARMAAGLRRRGWRVDVHGLEGTFPDADATAAASLDRVLERLVDGSRVLVDGLALGGLPDPIVAHRRRLHILALVHHPVSDETGLAVEVRARLADREQRALAAVAGVIVTSSFTRRGLGRFGVPAARVRVARPGTDPAPPAAGPGPGEPPQLLSVASVVPRKGHDVLVRALARLRDLPWRCVCAGSLERAPDHARRVRALVEEHGLAGRIRFTGECLRPVLDRLYAGSSLVVLASHYEGYGMVLTEALVRGPAGGRHDRRRDAGHAAVGRLPAGGARRRRRAGHGDRLAPGSARAGPCIGEGRGRGGGGAAAGGAGRGGPAPRCGPARLGHGGADFRAAPPGVGAGAGRCMRADGRSRRRRSPTNHVR